MKFIDTHAHIYLEPFEKDIDTVISGAREASVEKIFMPNINIDSIDRMIKLEKDNAGCCYSMIGLHPCSVDNDMESKIREMESWLSKREFSGIGETGTDLYWDKSFFDWQVASLEAHISWAKEYNIPIILHSRDSLDETISIIERNYENSLKGIFHCFNGNADQAKRIIDLNFLMGIGGVLTFKNSNLDRTIDQFSLAHFVLETDSPFLAPHPNRGKRNEPRNIPLIAEKMADIFGLTINEIAKITSENAEKTFQNG